jgi:hypothetical protein
MRSIKLDNKPTQKVDKMVKNKILISFFACILIIILCSYLLLFTKRNTRFPRELSQDEIRPILKHITERDLPIYVEELRAIFYSYHGLEDIFIAFKTNQEGCSFILNEFGSGQDILKQEFPDKEYNRMEFGMEAFVFNGYQFQKKLGIDLFDMDLIGRISDEQLDYVNTGRYPKDAVTGYYLKFIDNSKSEVILYRVLIFNNLNIVYIATRKVPKSFRSR